MRRRDLETAAAKYSYLRGLLFLPLGGLFILAALGNWEVGPLRHSWAFLAVAVALGLVYLLINRYYVENYGRLSPSNRQQVRAGVAVAIAVAVVLGGSLWGALLVTGALPVWNGADPSNIGHVLAGVAVMLSGVFDHRVFVDTFGPPKAVHHEDGDVVA
jgi:hypothetical protein